MAGFTVPGGGIGDVTGGTGLLDGFEFDEVADSAPDGLLTAALLPLSMCKI
jgi:hypothetical protein